MHVLSCITYLVMVPMMQEKRCDSSGYRRENTARNVETRMRTRANKVEVPFEVCCRGNGSL